MRRFAREIKMAVKASAGARAHHQRAHRPDDREEWRGRGRGRGHNPWDMGFGFGGPFGGGFGGPFGPKGYGRGRKAKRGDVRAAILALLAEQPRNGYQIIQEIAERSEGMWRPSPGAVYPALQQLADEGLVTAEESEGRRTFQLSEAGRRYVEEHPDEVREPWEAMRPQGDFGPMPELFRLMAQAGSAAVQVAHSGTESQVTQAKQVLDETRRKLYQILAEGDSGADDDES
ncbi:PadR family transcriptional regulator [Bailinhaonella thermotolerans]|uniref:PadR family transcriptional regulator n=2 Tax=Bailinhaonella thermotolerans TaxID=1070861 RepID=A0A3A4B6N3_9ACTN|nr:PadR family transcriptional regulator [Bailinhaonella thermotolerans]